MYRELLRAHTTALHDLPDTSADDQPDASQARRAANLTSDRPITMPARPRAPRNSTPQTATGDPGRLR